ncbi:MAG: phytanoyl-CoA dioxygenase family protein [Gemmatimonadota bacterium]|nr:phytanoyl-CoA dioxygenase family protein [Gemmatimonadota bacterium]
MHFDPRKLFEDGFIVLRGVVPPDWLGPLRDSFERMVDRQREIWTRERKPDDPPGGAWETGHQPRLQFETLVDGDTANTMAFCLHENTMGVSRRIMNSEAAGNTGFMFMCNPVTDRGPAPWHRDIHPIDQAPLRGLQDDLLHNAPGYLQWNIPLYDDNVLWVVPKSHRRGNTAEENRCLAQDPREPLPGGVQVELNAGDGVVYTNTILHWGSNYSARTRRTIHLGYRSYGGPIFPYVNRTFRDLGFIECLPSDLQTVFRDIRRRYDDETDRIESIFRAAIDGDEDAFQEGVAALHPGEAGRIICAVLLSKIVYKMRFATHPVRPHYGGDISHDEDLKPRFTAGELDALWRRFEPLDEEMQSDALQFVPGFQSDPMHYYFEEMPSGLSLESFMAGWRNN